MAVRSDSPFCSSAMRWSMGVPGWKNFSQLAVICATGSTVVVGAVVVAVVVGVGAVVVVGATMVAPGGGGVVCVELFERVPHAAITSTNVAAINTICVLVPFRMASP